VVVSASPRSNCDGTDLRRFSAGHRRIVVYSGVRYYPYQQGPVVLAARLAEIGRVREHRFSDMSTVYVVDLTAPPETPRPVDLTSIRFNCLRVIWRVRG
jgi:hypothetical protein